MFLYMSPEQYEGYIKEMKTVVEETIRTIVNGKIDSLRTDFKEHREEFKIYIKEDMKWKEEADPYIKLASNISGTWKFVVYVVVGLLSLFGFYNIVNKP